MSTAPKRALLDRARPVTRLLAALALSLATAPLHHLPAVLPALVLAALLLPLCGMSAAALFSRLLAVNAFVLLLWLVLPWSTPGAAVASVGPVVLSRQGLDLAWLVSLKANAMAMVFLTLVSGLSFSALGQGLRRLGLPAGLCLILALTHRYLYVLTDEHQRMVQAATLRGYRPGRGLLTYKTTANLLGMVLVRSLDRAERVRRAMLCRGFDGRFPLLEGGRATVADLGLAAASLCVAAACLTMEFA